MVYFIYALICLIWGSTWLAIKLGLEDSPPLWSAALRFVIACAVLFVINRLRHIYYPRQWSEIWKIAMPGIFMYPGSYIPVYVAEVYIDSALSAVLFASLPFFVAILSLVFLRGERIDYVAWIGLVIGLIGIVVIFYDSLQQSKFVFLGVAMMLISAASAALGMVLIRSRLQEMGIMIMAEIQLVAGTIFMILAAMIFEPLAAFKVTLKSIGALLYLSIFGTVIGFLSYYWLLKKIKAIALSQVTFINPIIAVILGFLVLSEAFNANSIVGSVLIMGGVAMVIRK